ncbi:MAG: adenylosuccinate lyase [Gammaproteobacteria bacterium]
MSLNNLSPIDGRYAEQCDSLRPVLSEKGLIYHRVLVEIKWFQVLSQQTNIKELPKLSQSAQAHLEEIIQTLDDDAIDSIKEIEKITNHDVKAVEYYLKKRFAEHVELKPYIEFIHFACTSEDINNLAYAIMIQKARNGCVLPKLTEIISSLSTFAKAHAHDAMLSRTHGQPASPTTMGKEIANTVVRLKRQQKLLADSPIFGKINGAVGNFNAHAFTYPEVDWIQLSESFVNSLGLKWQALTTQIEPHDYLSEHFHILMRINNILIDLSRDIWGYISLGYLKQKLEKNEVGSSTMPHKVNPINFENAEGNFGLANALFHFMAEKLTISRWQRDLTDSTVLRNIGVAFGHTLIGYHNLLKGLNKLAVNAAAIKQDLDNHWEILAEVIQTVMRRYGLPEPYEQLKQLTRGEKLDEIHLKQFVQSLRLPDAVKEKLLELHPAGYIGLAQELVELI